ncbi:DUF6653 family protein [Roseibium sp. RKSG952]|uniref:DUF6653 family protein n=1 Tax=Roseibium sp. RKSG952 TaxID=2529384 RepID=UPI0012BD4AF0|nr:DUF6653 family protein [Roseibium sp. RKSG952]MTH98305.1 hypothetical protein [Roseibium sp. RKSG952]
MQAQRIKPANRADASPVKRSRLQPFLARGPLWQQKVYPATVYFRILGLPALSAAIWSHVALGTGPAFLLTCATVVIMMLAPRLFGRPKGNLRWAAKSVYGERIWLNRAKLPIPNDDAGNALAMFFTWMIGTGVMIWGSIEALPVIAVPGLVIAMAAHISFQDRMVKVFNKMETAHPLYRFWAVAADNDNTKRKRKSA